MSEIYTSFTIEKIELDVLVGNEATVTVEMPLQGAKGDPGQGIPTGGDTGQVLAKNSNDDYDTTWVDPADEATWGNISGTLSDQIDLQSVLDAKTDDVDLAVVAKTGSYDDLTDAPLTPDATDISYDNTDSELEADNVQDAIDELKTLLPLPAGDWQIANIAPGWIDLFGGGPVDLGTDGFAAMVYKIRDNMVKGYIFGIIDYDNNMGAVDASLWVIDKSVLPAVPSNVQGMTFAVPSYFGYLSVFPDNEQPGISGLFAPAFPDLSGGLEDFASMAFAGDLPVDTINGYETLQYNGRLTDLSGRFASFQAMFEYPIQGTFVDGGDLVA